MTDGTDLLAAILANPDDDNVRLVYADWLQEQGDDARAEYIRRMVAQDTHRYAGWDCDMNSGEPPGPHHPTLTEITGIPNANGGGPVCRRWYWRGFVEKIELSAALWLQFADAITAAHPVTRVTLTTLPEFVRPENALRDVYQLRGRGNAWIVPQGEYIQPYLLHKEWPGIEFELPSESYWPHTSPADIV